MNEWKREIVGITYRKHDHFIPLSNTPLCCNIDGGWWLVPWGARARNNETADLFFVFFLIWPCPFMSDVKWHISNFTIINVWSPLKNNRNKWNLWHESIHLQRHNNFNEKEVVRSPLSWELSWKLHLVYEKICF